MKKKDRGSSRRPQARTRFAHGAVVDAARVLFLERGYGATTIDAISELSGVPPATVYRLFTSKRGILAALFDVSIGGDEQPVPMAERPAVQAAIATTEPGARLAAFAAITTAVNERIAPLYRILIGAASSDDDTAALLDQLGRQRQAGQRMIARSLAADGALLDGMTERDAADLIHALMSPELYQLLVVDRHWSANRYEQWLAATLANQLLEPDGST